MKVKNTIYRQVYKCITFGLSVLCLSNSLLLNVQATDDETVKTSVMNATYLLEDAIQKSWDKAEIETGNAIVQQKLDYRMTMDSFYKQDNPYLETDYLDMIAAYMVAKKYSNKLDKGDLYSLPFIEMQLEQKTVEEYKPKLIPVYQSRDGTLYELIGEEYVYEPIEVPVYRKVSDKTYEKTDETKIISLARENISYGEISLCGLSYKDILNYYEVNDEKKIKEFKEIKQKLENIVSGKGLSESVFIQVAQTNLLTPEISNYLRSLNQTDLSYEQKSVIKKAVTLIGRVPYEWGGKPKDGGYDNTWWTLQPNGKQKGLDCSGFVQWCFMDISGLTLRPEINLSSTTSILSSTRPITKSELQPGDLGLLHNGNAESTNHVGIYLGNQYWIHCSSGAKTVTVEQTDMFKVFRKMPEKSTKDTTNRTTTVYDATPITQEYTEQDIYLLAQLVYNEANAEGLNGWIAVAEVVKNRVNSPLFPDTIEEVIYQKDPVQFENSQMIAKREPRDEQISVVRQVLEGTLGILNNEDVLFFRNAKGSEENWNSYPFYMSINHHQFYTTKKEED